MTLQFFSVVVVVLGFFVTGYKSVTRLEVEGKNVALPQMRCNDYIFSSWRRKTIEWSPFSG